MYREKRKYVHLTYTKFRMYHQFTFVTFSLVDEYEVTPTKVLEEVY